MSCSSIEGKKIDRRKHLRVCCGLSVELLLETGVTLKGECTNISLGGMLIEIKDRLPESSQLKVNTKVGVYCKLENESVPLCFWSEIRWADIGEKVLIGIKFAPFSERESEVIYRFLLKKLFSDERFKNNDVPKEPKEDYTSSFIYKRNLWLEWKTRTSLTTIRNYAEIPEKMKGNIEYPIGCVQIPVGIAGPIKVNGEYARGEFYVPFATTEGALVATYHRGMRMVSKGEGINVRIIKDEVHISPSFEVRGIEEAQEVISWIGLNFDRIKFVAESTTKHGKLIRIDPVITGYGVVLKFVYTTGDAQGLNMINKATEEACKFISSEINKKYILRSNYSSVKKVSCSNIYTSYGRSVFADATIPRKTVKILKCTPEDLERYYQESILTSVYSGMVGMNAHVANGITAIYIACGQDVADISTSHIGISMCKVTPEGDLYMSLYIPNLLLGTVGGGTGLSTQKECLQIMGCYGSGKAKKFAEIVGATALAGEVAVLGALVTGTYVQAHERYGRNRPKD